MAILLESLESGLFLKALLSWHVAGRWRSLVSSAMPCLWSAPHCRCASNSRLPACLQVLNMSHKQHGSWVTCPSLTA